MAEIVRHRAGNLSLSLVAGVLAMLLSEVVALASPRSDIVINGSDTMVILMRRWAHTYSRLNQGVSIQVTGGGTGTGMAALVNRTTAVCMASRSIRPDEMEAAIKAFGRRPNQYEVALDALAVYVNDTNPMRALSLRQVADAFEGRVRDWREFGGPEATIALYGRENSSGTYEFFKERVLEGRDFSARIQSLPGTAAVLTAVARDRWSMGFGGTTFRAGVRAMPIRQEQGEAVLPTKETVNANAYPICRFLRVYVNPALDHGPLAEFLRWIRSDAGQAVVEEVGCFPLPPERRKAAMNP